MAVMAPDAVPKLAGIDPRALARQAEKRGRLNVAFAGVSHALDLPKAAAPLIARLDGRTPLGAVARAAGLDWLMFAQRFGPVWRSLTSAHLLHCSRGLR